MLSLLAVSLLILTANADVIDEDVNFSKVEDHFAVSNPAEKSEMIMEDLFIKYPTLKPATDKEIIEVKKSFMEFLDMNHVKQREIITGHPSQHKELSHVLKEFSKLATKEFDKLTDEEREFLGKVTDYVIHKLTVQEVLKVYKKKEEEGFRNGWIAEEIHKLSMLHGASLANSWGLDPEEITQEWTAMQGLQHNEL
ncbi:hypothetical protein PRIPAC_81841 [Pristionchus pacificus]|uniref:Uncharacterized protein n=1 Tax=Pristionchus pacificus TaxID=54126 RepID=A0A454Y106_PRIPA|nr:hypothetical protein PRIPAC_81841 [Pristionchus pacificus]|eukprot:PDM79737.1 hypothetical protein PRIPAC_32316 [Pristionchus pacificus]